MMESVFVHACNDGHKTVYEELYYSNDIGELSKDGGNWGGDQENPRVYGIVS